jgi:hypothetical protein
MTVTRYCKVCADELGRTSFSFGKVGGPLCEICFDRLERDSLAADKRPRQTWATWLRGIGFWR